MPGDDRPAVLFDVDGTLVDTNWFHALAWWFAFRKHGELVPASRIHPLIGMGGSELLETIFGRPRPDLKGENGPEYERFMADIVAFPSAGDLLRAIEERGARIVLCTSSKQAHLKPALAAIGADDAYDDVVNADDVEEAKPEPDVFAAGLDKLGLDRERSIVVGDTRWDVEAAARLGIPTVCVLTGGSTREQLLDAGAAAVYEDVADLLAHLDESPVGKLIST